MADIRDRAYRADKSYNEGGNSFGLGRTGTVTNSVAGGSSTDPYWTSVKLLIGNENGTNGGTSFIDQSSVAATVNKIGTVAWTNATAPTGLTTSVALTGTTADLNVADNAAYDLTGDFTLEGFAFLPDSSSSQFICMKRLPAGSGTNYIGIYTNGIGSLGALLSTSGASWAINTTMGSFSINTWFHWAIVRSGTTVYGCVGGTVTTVGTGISGTINKSAAALTMGGDGGGSGSGGMNGGRIAAQRLTVGVARYTANFTPPSLPFPTATT